MVLSLENNPNRLLTCGQPFYWTYQYQWMRRTSFWLTDSLSVDVRSTIEWAVLVVDLPTPFLLMVLVPVNEPYWLLTYRLPFCRCYKYHWMSRTGCWLTDSLSTDGICTIEWAVLVVDLPTPYPLMVFVPLNEPYWLLTYPLPILWWYLYHWMSRTGCWLTDSLSTDGICTIEWAVLVVDLPTPFPLMVFVPLNEPYWLLTYRLPIHWWYYYQWMRSRTCYGLTGSLSTHWAELFVDVIYVTTTNNWS